MGDHATLSLTHQQQKYGGKPLGSAWGTPCTSCRPARKHGGGWKKHTASPGCCKDSTASLYPSDCSTAQNNRIILTVQVFHHISTRAGFLVATHSSLSLVSSPSRRTSSTESGIYYQSRNKKNSLLMQLQPCSAGIHCTIQTLLPLTTRYILTSDPGRPCQRHTAAHGHLFAAHATGAPRNHNILLPCSNHAWLAQLSLQEGAHNGGKRAPQHVPCAACGTSEQLMQRHMHWRV